MLWIKSFHIILIASWFAGLFYLPRIFVNLAALNASNGQDAECQRLLGMGRRLYRFMTVLSVPALALGLWLWLFYGIGLVGAGNGWMHVKLAVVVVLVIYHLWCGRLLAQFEQGRNAKSHVWYRWFNEAPVVLMTIAVVMVVVKPF